MLLHPTAFSFERAGSSLQPTPCHARIAAIIKDGCSITAHTAIRLARFFGTSVEFWLNLQSQYEADIARAEIAEDLETIEPFAAA